MKKFLIAASVVLIASGAYAGPKGTNANANASAAVDSEAVAVSGAYNGGITQNYYNSGKTEIRNVPSVSAPGIVTAHNCALGASAGGAGVGWGISLGGSYADENCVLISEAAALNTLVGANVAVAHLARDAEMCQTLRATGVIGATSTCTAKERRAAQRSAAAAPATRISTRSAEPAVVPYSKCVVEDGKVVFRKKAGHTSAVARQACLTTLGY